MTDSDYADDPELTAREKEVTIRYARDSEKLVVTAEISSVVKWLDAHPEFEPLWHRRGEDGVVYAVSGLMPVGCLKLQGSSRQAQTPSGTLGQLPEEVEG